MLSCVICWLQINPCMQFAVSLTDIILLSAAGVTILHEDERQVCSYSEVKDGCVLLMLVLVPFNVYVRAVDGRMHTITVKSAQPDVSLSLLAGTKLYYIYYLR